MKLINNLGMIKRKEKTCKQMMYAGLLIKIILLNQPHFSIQIIISSELRLNSCFIIVAIVVYLTQRILPT